MAVEHFFRNGMLLVSTGDMIVFPGLLTYSEWEYNGRISSEMNMTILTATHLPSTPPLPLKLVVWRTQKL